MFRRGPGSVRRAGALGAGDRVAAPGPLVDGAVSVAGADVDPLALAERAAADLRAGSGPPAQRLSAEPAATARDRGLDARGRRAVHPARGRPAVEARVQPHYSTGLVREDFYDWPAHVAGVVRDASPDVVIFMLGGNDAQNIRLVDRRLLPMGSAEWAREYQRRAESVMRQLVGHGARRAYWVSMPPAASPGTRAVMRVANRATKAAAAAVPGIAYVDIWPQFATADGGFRGVVDGVDARQDDGVHFSRDGARLLAGRLLRILHRGYGLGT